MTDHDDELVEVVARCETCRWWGGRVSGRVYVPGPCRRYPPQVTTRVGQPPAIWPTVAINDFCGEHSAIAQLLKGQDDVG